MTSSIRRRVKHEKTTTIAIEFREKLVHLQISKLSSLGSSCRRTDPLLLLFGLAFSLSFGCCIVCPPPFVFIFDSIGLCVTNSS